MVESERRADELDGMDASLRESALIAEQMEYADEANLAGELHEQACNRLDTVRNAVKRAAVYDDEGDVDGLRRELGVIASVVGVDWIA